MPGPALQKALANSSVRTTTVFALAAGLLAACAMASPRAAEPWGAPPQLADLVEEVAPSVVQVASEREGASLFGFRDEDLPDLFRGSPFEDFFEQPEGEDEPFLPDVLTAGSGFVIDASGVIVTSNHIVEDAMEVVVRLKDGRELEARVVGSDDKTDIAVLAVEAAGLPPPLEWGDSDGVRVGDPIFAIGAPFGLGGTVTAGIVSARGRDIGAGPYDDFIQIDAPINQGNSGGPLFDTSGRVIGVTSAIVSPTGGNIGIGFAVPSTIAARVVGEIVAHGSVERGWLGVSVQPVTREIAAALGLAEASGALVAEVGADSPAARAGLLPGDVILAFDGARIATVHDLTTRAADADEGQSVQLSVYRGGRARDVSVMIGRMPSEPSAVAPARMEKPSEPETSELARLGLTLEDSSDGVVIAAVRLRGPAADAGLQRGDRVLMVNQQTVATVEDARRAVEQAATDGRSAVLLQIERRGQRRFVGVALSAF
jgi:serine protease Do